jgi:oligoendopeptidase F
VTSRCCTTATPPSSSRRSLGEFYDDAEAARAKRNHLEALTRLLPWIATIDAFQHWLYTHPDHSREQRTAFWLQLDERFGPAVSWDGLEQDRAIAWQRQLHLFEVPFYYIEYGIAQLGALQLWRKERHDHAAAIEGYRNLLRLGNSRPLPKLFEAAGIRFAMDEAVLEDLVPEVMEKIRGLLN